MSENPDSVVEFIREEEPTVDTIAICGQFRGRGGDARVVQQQAIDLSESGYRVTIFALEADMEPPEGVNLRTVNPVQDMPLLSKIYWLLFPILPWIVYTSLKLRGFDLIITHRYPFTVASYLASYTSNAIYTYWSHPSANTAGGFTGLAGLWSQIVHRFETRGRFISGAYYLCAVSQDSKQYLESHINRSVRVVPNKINERRFAEVAGPEDLREKYAIEEDDNVVLFVGRITERKNIHPLINITEDICGAKLVVAGSASQPEYANRIKEQAGSSTVFTGYVSDRELAGFYSLADVFATCSLEEGWGLPITEAQHFNTPVVAFTTHPAAKTIDNKILIDPGDYTAFKKAICSYITTDSNSDC